MKRKNRKNEQGVALIFAISIVGLMMMLAITYSALSVTNRDVAQNTSALFAARLLAENGVLRVKKVLDAYANNFSTNGTYAQIIHLRSKGEPDNSGTEKDDDLQEKLTSVRRNLFYDAANDTMNKIIEQSFLYPDPSLAPKWQFIRDTTGKIVGRFAFTTYKPFGLIDPLATSGTITTTRFKTVQENILSSKFNDLFYQQKDSNGNVQANPISNNKIIDPKNIKNKEYYLFRGLKFPANSVVRPYIDWQSLLAESYNIAASEYYKRRDSSYSLDSKQRKYKIPLSPSKETGNCNDVLYDLWVNHYLKSPASPYSGEYFWYDLNNNNEPTRYFRFNLNRSDWNNLVVEDIDGKTNIMNTQNLVKYSTTAIKTARIANNTAAVNTTCIPWFAKGSASKTQRQQAAANFIAFMAEICGQTPNSALCDTSKLYFANVRAPYLNEVDATIKFTLMEAGPLSEPTGDSTTYTQNYKLDVNVELYFEFVNYYKDLSTTDTYTIETPGGGNLFELSIPEFNLCANGSDKTISLAQPNGITANITTKYLPSFTTTNNGNGYYYIGGKYSLQTPIAFSVTSSQQKHVTEISLCFNDDVKAKFYDIVLKKNNVPVDYCKITDTAGSDSFVCYKGTDEVLRQDTSSGKRNYSDTFPISFKIRDCRNNLTGWNREPQKNDTSSNVNVTKGFDLPENTEWVEQPENAPWKIQHWTAQRTNKSSFYDSTTTSPICTTANMISGKIDVELLKPDDLLTYNSPTVASSKISVSDFHPGKLGLINRGGDFQTLNISVFYYKDQIPVIYNAQVLGTGTTSAQHGYYSGGMGNYEYGDAPLLDQLCWTPTIGTPASGTIPTAMAGAEYGKININMIHRKKYVRNSSVDSPTDDKDDVRDNLEAANLLFNSTGVTSRDISIARAQEPQNEKSTANKASAEFFFAAGNKSELEQKLTGTTPDRNHQFEERISFLDTSQIRYKDASGKVKSLKERLGFTGTSKSADEDKLKFIFLTEAGASTSEADDTIYVIGVAQIVNERLVNVKRDSSGNIQRYTSEYGTWDSPCDEVLATQKVIAVLQRNNREKWEIVRIEYVE